MLRAGPGQAEIGGRGRDAGGIARCRDRHLGPFPHLPDGGRAGGGSVAHQPRHRAGRLRFADRAVRLREDDAAARHRRSRAADFRVDTGQRTHARRSSPHPLLRLRLPSAGALSLAHHRKECRAAARSDRDAGGRTRGEGAEEPRARQPDGLRAPLPLAALRWHAAARLDRPCALPSTRRCF